MKKSPGKVYLVGAGPGDPGLITVKGIRCLNEADVIIYDHLINDRFLSDAPATTEKINVGKQVGKKVLEQREINKLLVKKALSGKTVVRLKGGDPFLFGRGGEEAEFEKRNFPAAMPVAATRQRSSRVEMRLSCCFFGGGGAGFAVICSCRFAYLVKTIPQASHNSRFSPLWPHFGQVMNSFPLHVREKPYKQGRLSIWLRQLLK